MTTNIIMREVAKHLQALHLRISLAESCTGGLVAAHCTDLAGSSIWFERGFVTYSNEAKIELLGVYPETLYQHGAVSHCCAKQMAEGALRNSHADLALSITGIAGPSGGSDAKPVGTVFFGLAQHEKNSSSYQQHFKGNRSEIRAQALHFALSLILSKLT